MRAIAESQAALNRLKETNEACDRWQKVLEKVTPRHPEMVTLLLLRAKIDRRQGDFVSESLHLLEAIQRESVLPQPSQSKIGDMKCLLAAAYRLQDKNRLAMNAIEEAMAFFKGKLKPTDPQRLSARLERGRIALAWGKIDTARSDFEAVLKSWRKIAGDNHRVLLGPLRGLLALAKQSKTKSKISELEKWVKRIETQK